MNVCVCLENRKNSFCCLVCRELFGPDYSVELVDNHRFKHIAKIHEKLLNEVYDSYLVFFVIYKKLLPYGDVAEFRFVIQV